ncbi:MAG: hypothetical protein IJF13_01515 [Clostridia bacterium]|nr:hypothetical protein [Clostridia bacterium]
MSHKSKMIAPIVVTAIIAVYYAFYFGLIVAVVDSIWKYVLGVIPLVMIALLIWVCIERITEIRKGEEDDLSNY